MGTDKSRWLFIVSLIGLAVCAVAVILMLPALTRDGDQSHLQLLAGVAVVGAFCAVGTRKWRPHAPDTNSE